LHHQKGPVFWAECQMRFPKRSLRSTAQSENLKTAINEVKDELQRQLKQYKNKLTAKRKRGARVLKKEIRLSSQARFYRKGRIREEGI
jgi:ribosome-associated translation inhibitor RaiA